MVKDNQFKPTFKQPFIPKTETRIFLGGRPIDQQAEQTNSKSVNKQHYQSSRVGEINPSYGPGFWDDVVKPVGKVVGQTVGAAAIVATGPVTGTVLAVTAIAGGQAQKELTEAHEDKLPEPVKEYIDFTADNSIEAGKTALKILTLNQVKIDE